jgi:hypothetical protein
MANSARALHRDSYSLLPIRYSLLSTTLLRSAKEAIGAADPLLRPMGRIEQGLAGLEYDVCLM